MKKIKTKAIFLDRDGTIVRHTKKFIVRASQLRLLAGVPEALRAFNEMGFLAVLITNQPVISRGLITPRGMEKLHASLFERLKRRGARIDAAYVCPHHPDGKIPPYGRKCRCRKPEPGMILQAIKDMNIDPRKSFMIGDALIDIVTGKKAHTRTILVKTGPGHSRLDKFYQRTKPNFVAKNLLVAARIVKKVK
ncbi:MAG: HAD family hydrolase [Candidatus Brennerbacteria bacterium]|nr:HAD family hydrolase [Candidatus Brennerbacteria bacterium]